MISTRTEECWQNIFLAIHSFLLKKVPRKKGKNKQYMQALKTQILNVLFAMVKKRILYQV